MLVYQRVSLLSFFPSACNPWKSIGIIGSLWLWNSNSSLQRENDDVFPIGSRNILIYLGISRGSPVWNNPISFRPCRVVSSCRRVWMCPAFMFCPITSAPASPKPSASNPPSLQNDARGLQRSDSDGEGDDDHYKIIITVSCLLLSYISYIGLYCMWLCYIITMIMSDFFLIVTTSYDWHDYDKAIKPLTFWCAIFGIPSGLMMVFSSITVSIGSC